MYRLYEKQSFKLEETSLIKRFILFKSTNRQSITGYVGKQYERWLLLVLSSVVNDHPAFEWSSSLGHSISKHSMLPLHIPEDRSPAWKSIMFYEASFGTRWDLHYIYICTSLMYAYMHFRGTISVEVCNAELTILVNFTSLVNLHMVYLWITLQLPMSNAKILV